MFDITPGDVVELSTGEIVLVTDVPDGDAASETLFVYTRNLDNGVKTEDDLGVTDRQFIADHLGGLVTVARVS